MIRETGVCLRVSRRQEDCTRVPAEELEAQERRAVALAVSTRSSGAASEGRSGWEGRLSEPKRCVEEVAVSDRLFHLAEKVSEPHRLQIPTWVHGVTAGEQRVGLARAFTER